MKTNPKIPLILGILLLLPGLHLFGQVSINTDGTLPDNSAMLEIRSSSKGFLPPKMTHAALNAIVSPSDGLQVFCTDCGPNGLGAMAMFMYGTWYTMNVNCLNPPSPPSAGTHVPSPAGITWNWNAVPGAAGYKWNTIDDIGSATDMGTNTTKAETGLTCTTVYTRYVWAYTSCGSSASMALTQETTWICGCPITDSRDGKTYNSVVIGSQCWMAQNLNTGTRINASLDQTNNGTIEKYCANDDTTFCNVYGGLYQWDETMNYTTPSNTIPSGRKGICPDGWHVPSDAEWCQMKQYLDATFNCNTYGYAGTDVAGKLKETGTVHWASPNVGATNSSGFTGLPAGARYPTGSISDLTFFGYMWSSTESYPSQYWYHILASTSSQAGRYPNVTAFGFSVRCVKD